MSCINFAKNMLPIQKELVSNYSLIRVTLNTEFDTLCLCPSSVCANQGIDP